VFLISSRGVLQYPALAVLDPGNGLQGGLAHMYFSA